MVDRERRQVLKVEVDDVAARILHIAENLDVGHVAASLLDAYWRQSNVLTVGNVEVDRIARLPFTSPKDHGFRIRENRLISSKRDTIHSVLAVGVRFRPERLACPNEAHDEVRSWHFANIHRAITIVVGEYESVKTSVLSKGPRSNSYKETKKSD